MRLSLFIIATSIFFSFLTPVSFAEDIISPPPTATVAIPPTNTAMPAPSATAIPAPSNTTAPAATATNAPAATTEVTKAPAPTTNLNKVIKITKTIPPTLDPDEAKLLAVTPSDQSLTTPSATITPSEEEGEISASFRFLPFLILLIVILTSAFSYNHYKKTGKWIPDSWKEKLQNLKKPKTDGGLRKL